MSAIAGIWRMDGKPAVADLERALAALHPYGPDDSASWVEKDVGVGRRLMRLDPSEPSDGQPLIGGGGRFLLVADVRLDNRQELAAALGLSPREGAAMADARLVLSAFERWGEDCPRSLYGDYAFAVWDRSRERWFMARDAMGGRPLHYFQGPGLFVFASMPKGLHALPDIPYAVDEELLGRAFTLARTDPEASCFQQIKRVGIGESVVITRAGRSGARHWNPSLEPLRLSRPADYEEALREHLDRAVSDRLPARGDVSAQLSAGLDSSAVASTAARQLSARRGRVIAFTSVPRGDADAFGAAYRLADEGPIAAMTAALYPNMDHVRVATPGRSPLAGCADAFELAEQPWLNLCNRVWIDAISDQAQARGLTVMLTGQMGNLTLSYKGTSSFKNRLRRADLSGALNELRIAAWLRGHDGWDGIARATRERLTELWRSAGREPGEGEPASLLNPAWGGGSGVPDGPQGAGLPHGPAMSRVAAMHRVDLANGRKATLARWRFHELDPTSDRRLAEFCLRVPEAQLRFGGLPAALTRRALADRLPPAVTQLRTRGIQAIDWHMGLTEPERQLGEVADRLAACPATARLLDIRALRAMIRRWPNIDWNDPGTNQHYRLTLLRAISYGDFLRRGVAAQAGGRDQVAAALNAARPCA
ncbi:MAG: asparagine synthetase B family protein [Brevundimonas sp.]